MWAALLLLARLTWVTAENPGSNTIVLEELTVTKTEFSAFVCEYGSPNTVLSCPAGTLVQVEQSFFGAWARSSSRKCSFTPYNKFNTSCLLRNVPAVFKACNSKASCSIPREPNPLNPNPPSAMLAFVGFEPCDFMEKYLLVTYNCKDLASFPPLSSPESDGAQAGQQAGTSGSAGGSSQTGTDKDAFINSIRSTVSTTNVPASTGKLDVKCWSLTCHVNLSRLSISPRLSRFNSYNTRAFE